MGESHLSVFRCLRVFHAQFLHSLPFSFSLHFILCRMQLTQVFSTGPVALFAIRGDFSSWFHHGLET